MGKNFRLTRQTRLYELPEASFTHLEAICAGCGAHRRQAIWDVCGTHIGRYMLMIEAIEKRLECPCGGRMVHGSLRPWAEHIRYKGPR